MRKSYSIRKAITFVPLGGTNLLSGPWTICLPMDVRAKLRCRRLLSSFLSKPFVCFGGLSDIVRKRRQNRQQWCISGKPSFSLAGVANERINDGHAQREREASQALHLSALHGMWAQYGTDLPGSVYNMAMFWSLFTGDPSLWIFSKMK